MNQGDALAVALGATMALMLASRALRNAQLSLKAKALMAAVWVVVITVGAMIAAWWQR